MKYNRNCAFKYYVNYLLICVRGQAFYSGGYGGQFLNYDVQIYRFRQLWRVDDVVTEWLKIYAARKCTLQPQQHQLIMADDLFI